MECLHFPITDDLMYLSSPPFAETIIKAPIVHFRLGRTLLVREKNLLIVDYLSSQSAVRTVSTKDGTLMLDALRPCSGNKEIPASGVDQEAAFGTGMVGTVIFEAPRIVQEIESVASQSEKSL